MLQKQGSVPALFVIGLSRNKEVNKNELKLNEEMRIYDDFIVGDFVDSYRNLTLKTLTSYTYFATYCDANQTQWVVLNDDDTFVDQFQLDRLLPNLPINSRSEL